MLTSARAAFADKPNTPRGCESLEEMGVASMEDRMQRTMDLYKSNPNTFRLKPIRKPELPEAARASSPRWHTRSAFNMSVAAEVLKACGCARAGQLARHARQLGAPGARALPLRAPEPAALLRALGGWASECLTFFSPAAFIAAAHPLLKTPLERS